MGFTRRCLRLVAALAAGVWLLAATIPALARGAGIADDTLTLLCTAQGMRWVAVSGDTGGSAPPASSQAADHCPLCALGASLGAPPEAVGFRAPAAAGALPLARWSELLPAARVARSAQPRAPPSAS